LRDIFALWYLVTEPRVPGGPDVKEFGYSQVFNGIGVFLYQKDDVLRIVAKQDLGVDRIELSDLDRKVYKREETGCTIKPNNVNWKLSDGTYGALTIILNADQGQLSISYLNDRRELKECIVKQPFSSLSYQGYFGITARNIQDSSANFDMHLKSVRLTNYDPTKYRRNEELFTIDENEAANKDIVELRNALGYTDEEFLEQLSGPDSYLVFTDELKSEASDLLKKYTD
jgi:hypothetical protein